MSRAFAQLALAATASAAALANSPKTGSAGTLTFPLTRRHNVPVDLFKRDDTVGLLNATTATYLFTLAIGTPPQNVSVVLDTGSFELWVNPTCSTSSTQAQANLCAKAGQYDSSSSSTSATTELADKTLRYGKGEVDITYVADSVTVPGTDNKAMTNVTFGVGQGSSEVAFGIAGVGHGIGYNTVYPNIIDDLADQGLISSKLMSIGLGPQLVNDIGTVTFGGVDTKKYIGKLAQFPILAPSAGTEGADGPVRYWVELNGLGITTPGGKPKSYTTTPSAVVLDTGSTLTYLPSTVLANIGKDMGATLTSGFYIVDCSKRKDKGTVDFTFGNTTFGIPYDEFIWEAEPGTCALGAVADDDIPVALLGDSFLRSIYAVFDQTNNDIYMAMYADCGSNEHPLTAAPGAAGAVEGECKAAATGAAGAMTPVRALAAVVALAVGVVIMA